MSASGSSGRTDRRQDQSQGSDTLLSGTPRDTEVDVVRTDDHVGLRRHRNSFKGAGDPDLLIHPTSKTDGVDL